jgi:hypothetical protein
MTQKHKLAFSKNWLFKIINLKDKSYTKQIKLIGNTNISIQKSSCKLGLKIISNRKVRSALTFYQLVNLNISPLDNFQDLEEHQQMKDY